MCGAWTKQLKLYILMKGNIYNKQSGDRFQHCRRRCNQHERCRAERRHRHRGHRRANETYENHRALLRQTPNLQDVWMWCTRVYWYDIQQPPAVHGISWLVQLCLLFSIRFQRSNTWTAVVFCFEFTLKSFFVHKVVYCVETPVKVETLQKI